jgi:SAM-dependent methyltransferase
MFQSSDNRNYSGIANLEVMSKAVNYNNHIRELIFKNALSRDAKTVCDFGAGSGEFCYGWKEKNIDLSLVELDPELRCRLSQLGYEVNELDALPDNLLDYIYSINVLEHISDDTDILKKLHSKLKCNGALFIYVPANRFLWTAMDVNVGHYRRYQKKELALKLRQAGFEVSYIRYADPIGCLATLAFKLFGKESGELSAKQIEIYDRYIFPFSQFFEALSFGRLLGKNLYALAVKRGF